MFEKNILDILEKKKDQAHMSGMPLLKHQQFTEQHTWQNTVQSTNLLFIHHENKMPFILNKIDTGKDTVPKMNHTFLTVFCEITISFVKYDQL